MRLPHVPPTLREALQVMALRRARDEQWVKRVIKREQWKRVLCRACATAVDTLHKIGRL